MNKSAFVHQIHLSEHASQLANHAFHDAKALLTWDCVSVGKSRLEGGPSEIDHWIAKSTRRECKKSKNDPPRGEYMKRNKQRSAKIGNPLLRVMEWSSNWSTDHSRVEDFPNIARPTATNQLLLKPDRELGHYHGLSIVWNVRQSEDMRQIDPKLSITSLAIFIERSHANLFFHSFTWW
jgi:hypothetical protein